MKAAALALAALILLPLAVRAQVDERVMYASVVDGKGAPITNVTAKDLIVREDGQAREILNIAKDDDPLQIALLVDNSVSMRENLSELRRSVSSFVTSLRPGIQVALLTLAERPTIVLNYTADHAALVKATDRIVTYEAGNYLLDGIAEAAEGLKKRSEARSIMVVVTGDGPELSYRHYSDTVRALRDSSASLHAILVTSPTIEAAATRAVESAGAAGDAAGGLGRDIVLGRMTKETGGRYEQLLSIHSLAAKLEQLSDEISNQYRVTFARPQRLVPPRSTEISARQPNLHVRGMLKK
jgi:VWFA-related protein